MNRIIKFITLSLFSLACHAPLQGQTIEWASDLFTEFQQSNGAPLDNTFIVELGSFENGFVPTEMNWGSWSSNWVVFDEADFDPSLGYFTSSADMNAVGGSTSTVGDPNFDFQNLLAYMWIRNEDRPSDTAEWYLGQDPAWVFPTSDGDDCCNNSQPLQWRLSGPIDLEPIPEPGTSLLLLLTAAPFFLRRRRA